MISVIVPIYNSEKYIAECLDSIIAQTYKDLEIILVDDGSTDGSVGICKNYAQKDSRITLICQENAGSSAARRTGLSASNGEYISFVDSDDWLDLCFYEKLYELLNKHDADIVVSGCIQECDGMQKHQKNLFEEGFYDKKSLRENVYPQMMCYRNNGPFAWGILQYLWNKIFKREVIEPCINQIAPCIYDGEDVACVFDACLRATDIYVDNHGYYHYRVHEESICNRARDEKYLLNAMQLHKYMCDIFSDCEDGELLLAQLPYFMSMFINNGTQSMFGYHYKVAFSDDYLLPNFPQKEGVKVCLYGAGNVGGSFYAQLVKKNKVEVVSWTDSKKFGKKMGLITLDKPDEALTKDWDYVIIALYDEWAANEIREWLLAHGVEQNAIIWEQTKRLFTGYELVIDK